MSCNTRGRDRLFLVGLLDEQFLDQALENAGRSLLELIRRLDVRDPDSAPLIWLPEISSEFTFGGNLSGGLRAAIITIRARSEQKCCRDCCQAGVEK